MPVQFLDSVAVDGNVTANDVILVPNGTAAGSTGEVRFLELVANGTNYVSFKSPDALAANVNYVLPNADGTSGQHLMTDGAGNLSWGAATVSFNTTVGGATSIAVTHNLASTDLVYKFRRLSDNAEVHPGVVYTNANTLTLSFTTAPAAADIRVSILKA